ncbi:MAG: dihydrolipoamide acetyltransferase family protein [Dehalococcoidia bacterium]
MATDVIMPQMGFDMEEGTVVRWLKGEGEEVNRGEPIVEIETDKATVEVEAFASGILRRIVVAEGNKVPVGQMIGIIASADEELPTIETPVPAPSTTDKPTTVKASPASEVKAERRPGEKKPGERLLISPLARRIAEEKGVDLGQVKGTGPKGRITKEDVQAFAAEAPAPAAAPVPSPPSAPGELVVTELSKMRQTIARRMTQSKQEVPHFYVTTSIDMTRALGLREELNELWEGEVRVSVNDLIIKATALALIKHSSFNSYYDDGKVKRNPQINIGMAIALEDGLIAPAILDCAAKSLKEIAVASRDLVNRARNGVLKPREYTDATIAISNLGMFDIDSFIAIINPLQSASVAVGSVRKQPVVRDGQVVIVDIMQATVSADHRVVNGAEAAHFLNEIKGFLQKPASLLV